MIKLGQYYFLLPAKSDEMFAYPTFTRVPLPLATLRCEAPLPPRGRLFKRVLIVNSTPPIENSRKLFKIEQIPAVFFAISASPSGRFLFLPLILLGYDLFRQQSVQLLGLLGIE